MFAASIFCVLLSCFFVTEAQFVIDRGERDVFRNLTGCSRETPYFCYFLHAEESELDPCVCRCKLKYPMYRNPDVFLSGGQEFMSKGQPACVWHSNHRYECFHIRKLGRGFHTSDDEEALEFDLSKPGSVQAFSDHDLSTCTGVDAAIKMPEDSDFTPCKTDLLTATYGRFDVIRFEWTGSAERYGGGILRGVFKGCSGNIDDAGRCFVGKITGIYNGGNCSVRALNDECCVLPFTYKGQVYNNCTTVDSEEAWCAVRLRFFENETNWWQNCTNSTKVIPSSPTIQSSPTINISQHAAESFSATETMTLQTQTVSVANSLSQLESTQVLKSTETIKMPILGPKPGPKVTSLVSKGNETTMSLNVRGTQLLSQFNASSTVFKLTPSVHKPTITSSLVWSYDQISSTIDHTSSMSDYTPSVFGITPTMVNYKSSISDHGHYNQTSRIDHTSLINNTSSVIDYEITRSSEFNAKSIDFTSSVSDYKSSIIDHVSSVAVPEQSITDYTLSSSDYTSSIINHVPSITVLSEQSTIDYTLSASDYRSSISGRVSSIVVLPEQSIIDDSFSTSNSMSSSSASKLSMNDHRSRMSDYISSISDHKTTVSGYKPTMSTTNQYTSQYKTLLTGTISSQTVATPTSLQMMSSISSVVLPDIKATDSDSSSVAIVIVIVMATVTFVVVSLVCCLFLGWRQWKNRAKKYRVINRKSGNQATQSPATQRPDTETSIQTDIVNVEESESEIAETEFTIPEKNDKEISDKPSGKDYGPEFMTFRL